MNIDVDSPDTHRRITEIAEIVAAGLMRLAARKSSAKLAAVGESSLDFSPKQSGHPNPVNGRETDG
ncbi:hypothetical protein [Pseudorhodoplanes sinuspersici]|uniref:Uncharacterized protein n=1 Tax=Pseudorhodoplanes sinuspersici TaxID=1235591 RepID=A0A1W6ZLP9_9HYPH|nr:hypothetical protein [Pseudorhodoplanes sinuspersici]ARP98242.1 hypothetical protein CAK95_03410 [Pseudorhodoplanes sinuspersici]RKE68001.1 hypothetical protein DFP91_4355 [Pseudorhodoplanes sinuspersici]